MSRVGKQPIIIPNGVEVKINGPLVFVKGPKGELNLTLDKGVTIVQKEQTLELLVAKPEDKKQRSLWGLFRRLVDNMILGVTQGFSKQLEINGVGYKAAATGSKLVLNVGYSHPVEYQIPKGITILVEKNIITITGFDKQLVGQVAAEIRKIRPPEPYKGKGIKYTTEVIRRKVGKAAAAKSE